MAVTISVDERVYRLLEQMAEREGRSMGEIIADAIDQYEQAGFWTQVRESYARLRNDPVEWESWQREIAFFENANMDGLEDEPPYYTPEEIEEIKASRP